MSIEQSIQKIQNQYDPEFDVPQKGQPPVTWAEAELADAVKSLLLRVERLEAQNNELRQQIMRQ